ncbi:MAG TPA: CPBP family intramembrane glutamic endopeptidase [Dongiaceae bacterium]|nr:CPBP family intramembrane glutamic endopeptidase [Dongiaceae bacterium]
MTGSRALLVATALQSVLAAVLVGRGAVTFVRAPLADAIGVLAGVAIGFVSYRLLAARDVSAPRRAGRGAIVALAVVYTAISVAEEILWRGYAFDRVAASRGALVALVVTTAGFAIVHGIPQGYAGVRFHLVTGLVFGLTLLATSSLAGAAAAHVAYNLAVLIGTVAPRKGAFHDPLAVG